VEGFMRQAHKYKRAVFGVESVLPRCICPPELSTDPSLVEAEFWRLAGGDERVGKAPADFDTTCYAAVAMPKDESSPRPSGFALPEEPGAKQAEEPYVSSPWNLHNFIRQVSG